MSYRKQYFEWDVMANEVLTGIPVGYEVEFAQNLRFYPILYRLTTFEEVTGEAVQGTFFYSLDQGLTWNNYPLGEYGLAFSQSYKMRLVVKIAETESIYVQRDAVIYRITGDGRSLVDSYEINGISNFNQIDMQEQDNTLCLVGGDTLYRFKTGELIEPYSNSINLNGIPTGIAVDAYRQSFWDIREDSICLKDLNGDILFCVANPLTSMDYSSSSSSASSESS